MVNFTKAALHQKVKNKPQFHFPEILKLSENWAEFSFSSYPQGRTEFFTRKLAWHWQSVEKNERTLKNSKTW